VKLITFILYKYKLYNTIRYWEFSVRWNTCRI